MPQIREYTSQTQVPGAFQSRAAHPEQFGYGKEIRQFGDAVQGLGEAIYKRKEQSELSDASVALSEAHATFTKQLQDDLQKGTINSDEFAQKYDDYVSQAGDQFTTAGARDYFRKSSAQLRSHFVQSSFAAQSELAGVKARESYEQSFNKFSSGLVNDPSSYDTVKKLHNDYVDGLVKNGSLPAHIAEQLKVEGQSKLAKSAVSGSIALDPEAAKTQLKDGLWDSEVNGLVKTQLLGEADQGIRAKEIELERRQKLEEKQKQQQQRVTQNDLLSKMVEGSLSSKEILNSNLEAFGSGSKEQFLQLMKTHQEQKIQTDPGVFTNVFNRIHLPDTDPNKITDENELNGLLGKGLTLSNIKDLREELQGKGTEAGQQETQLKKLLFDQAQARLSKANPLTGQKDPYGDQQLAAYQSFFMQRFQEERRNGKTPLQLLDPESKDYLGKYISNYVKSPDQVMRENLKLLQPPERVPLPESTSLPSATPNPDKARKPGESIEQWRARTKGTP